MTTERFKISAGKLIGILVPLFLTKWRDLIFILLIVMVWLSTVRIEFALVALMIIFLVIPMGLLYLFSYYALLPEVCTAVLLKTATFSDEGVFYTYFRKPKKEENTDEVEVIDTTDEVEEWEVSHTALFKWEQFSRYERRKDMILLVFNDSRYKFLAIPYSAFTDLPQFNSILELIKSKIRK
ncbi:MAG: YcxB family protein [Bacteroidales bacterium]